MREHVNSAPADDELATSAKLAAPLGAAWRHHGEGNSDFTSAVRSMESDHTLRTPHDCRPCRRCNCVPCCASASSAVFDDFNGPPGSAPNPASWSYVTGRGGTGASKPIAPPTLSLTGKAIRYPRRRSRPRLRIRSRSDQKQTEPRLRQNHSAHQNAIRARLVAGVLAGWSR